DDEEELGTTVLPLARIKKILKFHPSHISCNEATVFATAIATELFVQYLTEQALINARIEKRKKLTYKDFSQAASVNSNLNFLTNVVPKTQSVRKLVRNDAIRYSKA
ncbi:DNA polymerase epsilon noncatalytic subunit, partial [Ascoidea rubescens DSM 1968]